jgi:hypothetical protein
MIHELARNGIYAVCNLKILTLLLQYDNTEIKDFATTYYSITNYTTQLFTKLSFGENQCDPCPVPYKMQ